MICPVDSYTNAYYWGQSDRQQKIERWMRAYEVGDNEQSVIDYLNDCARSGDQDDYPRDEEIEILRKKGINERN